MSAIGPKRTSQIAPHMSAFGGKADMTVCRSPLSRSRLGAKRTCLFALHMSAFDTKSSRCRWIPNFGRDLLPMSGHIGLHAARDHPHKLFAEVFEGMIDPSQWLQ